MRLMIPRPILSILSRREPETVELEDSTELTEHEHDLVLRYALVGVFLIHLFAVLWLTKVIALPLVAGVILGLVLGPAVDRLARWGVPQGLAAALMVLAGILFFTAIATVLAAPLALWFDSLPGIFAALRARLSGLFAQLEQLEKLTAGLGGAVSPDAPPKVTVTDGSPLVDLALNSSAVAGGLLVFTATVYFYLATRRHLKARVLRLCLGRHARRSAGRFFDDIELKISAYFGTVTLINAGMGVVTGLIAWLAGWPVPIFWGVGAFVFNYIAFIGPVIMTALMVGAGLMTDGPFLTMFWPAAAYFVVHLLEGNIVTPIAVGRRLTVSPFLVFVSFIFWLWLWGPLGAILSTPILLVITVATEVVIAYRKAPDETPDVAVAKVEAAVEAREDELKGPDPSQMTEGRVMAAS
jgi:predicted PurR-regulated permease PerM